MNGSEYLLDSNVWIALTFSSHPAHAVAAAFMESVTEKAPAIFCRSTQQSFLRLATTPRMIEQYGATGMTNATALDCLDLFLASPKVAYREEPAGVFERCRQLANRAAASSKVWMDAYLAAFAIDGQLTFVTLDQDFSAAPFKDLQLILLTVPEPTPLA